MKRFSLILTIVALALGMTQCRKPIIEPIAPVVNNGELQTITFGTDNGSKVVVNNYSDLKWSANDKLYVYSQDENGSEGEYLGLIELTEGSGSPTGKFSGNVKVGSYQKMVFYYYAAGIITNAPSATVAPQVSADFTNQTGDNWTGFTGIQNHLIMSCKLDVNPEGSYDGTLTPCFAVLPIEITGGQANITVTDVPGNVITVNGSGILSYGSTSKEALSITYANANQKVAMAAPATRSFIDTKVEFKYGTNDADKFDMTMDEVTVVQGSIIAAQKITVQLKSEGDIIHPTTEGTVISFNNETGLVTVKMPGNLSDQMPAPKQYVAKVVETDTKYETLKAAFEAVYTAGNNYGANNTVELLCDVDMTDGQGSIAGGTKTAADWTPVGTKAAPYKGSFNGNGFTISNMHVTANQAGVGLIGGVEGTANGSYTSINDVWDGTQLNENAISENKYTSVLKNVRFVGVNIDCSGSENEETGTLVGYAKNAYISNVIVGGTSSIKGYKRTGGVTGTIDGSVVRNVKTESGVTIGTYHYHQGGIVGGYVYSSAVVDCENNALLSNDGGGFCGGVMSDLKNPNTIVYNCTNNADINITGVQLFGGICVDEGGGVIANCTNNGNLTITTRVNGGDDCVGGITAYSNGSVRLYNCHNKGNVTGSAPYVSGIDGCIVSTVNIEIDGCSNTGTVVNNKEDGKVSDFANMKNVNNCVVKNVTFSNVEALNKAFWSGSVANITFDSSVTVTNNGGDFVVPSCQAFTSANKIATGLNLSKLSGTVSVSIPDLSTTLSGDHSGLNLALRGANSNITLASDAKFSWFALAGDGTGALTVNSTALGGSVSFSMNGTVTIANGANVKGLSFGGTDKTITANNYGTISYLAEEGKPVHHVVEPGDHSFNTVTFNNHGTVSIDSHRTGTSNEYLFLDYGSRSFTVNLYSESVLSVSGRSHGTGWLAVYMFDNIDEDANVYINYQAEAQYKQEGSTINIPFTSHKSNVNNKGKYRYVTVAPMQ